MNNEKNDPQADVVMALNQIFMFQLKGNSVLEKYIPKWSNEIPSNYKDADGYFYIRYSEKQIICKFNLEQRMIYPKTQETYKFILDQICELFNVKLGLRTRKNYKKSYYIIKIENQKSINLLIDYLNNYSLLSSKYLDYLE